MGGRAARWEVCGGARRASARAQGAAVAAAACVRVGPRRRPHLGDGRVFDALGPVLLQQPARDLVCALVLPHLLAHDHDLVGARRRGGARGGSARARRGRRSARAPAPAHPSPPPCPPHLVVPGHLLVDSSVQRVTHGHLRAAGGPARRQRRGCRMPGLQTRTPARACRPPHPPRLLWSPPSSCRPGWWRRIAPPAAAGRRHRAAQGGRAHTVNPIARRPPPLATQQALRQWGARAPASAAAARQPQRAPALASPAAPERLGVTRKPEAGVARGVEGGRVGRRVRAGGGAGGWVGVECGASGGA